MVTLAKRGKAAGGFFVGGRRGRGSSAIYVCCGVSWCVALCRIAVKERLSRAFRRSDVQSGYRGSAAGAEGRGAGARSFVLLLDARIREAPASI
jgi:hypothetical protein